MLPCQADSFHTAAAAAHSVTWQPEVWLHKGGTAYAEHMAHIYEAITAVGKLNYCGMHLQLSSNLCFKE